MATELRSLDSQSWKYSIKHAFRDLGSLLEFLELEPGSAGSRLHVGFGTPVQENDFRLLVTREFASRMTKGNWCDPLLLQVLPVSAEKKSGPGFSDDPVGDGAAEVLPGLLHKYQGRVLFVLTGACAVHCRYCFRRHFPYSNVPKNIEGLKPAIDYIRSDGSIEEVILSGGDPLMVSDSVLEELLAEIEAIEHIKRIRCHTRMPVLVPGRVTEKLVDLVGNSRLSWWFVVHINHAREIDPEVALAAQRLKRAGATMLNQAVFLRGVNDTFEAQRDLCKQLIDIGITPYYLHQLDRVEGAGHFEADRANGLEIIRSLRSVLPGYAIPEFVQEIPGEPSKTPISSSWVSSP